MKIMLRGTAQEFITAEEIQERLNNEEVGFLSFNKGYIIGGIQFFASGLTLFPNETKVFIRNDKLIVTAMFRQYMLPECYKDGNDDQLVEVECSWPEDTEFMVVLDKVK